MYHNGKFLAGILTVTRDQQRKPRTEAGSLTLARKTKRFASDGIFSAFPLRRWNDRASPIYFLLILSKHAFSFASSPFAIFLHSSAVLGSSAAKMGSASDAIKPNMRAQTSFFMIMLLLSLKSLKWQKCQYKEQQRSCRILELFCVERKLFSEKSSRGSTCFSCNLRR